MVKNLSAMRETKVRSLGSCWEDLEKQTATHCSILAWRIPRTEEPCGLQFIGFQRVRQQLSDFYFHFVRYPKLKKIKCEIIACSTVKWKECGVSFRIFFRISSVWPRVGQLTSCKHKFLHA